MTIHWTRATWGCELELAGVDRAIHLPEGNTWCRKDGSICNPNGTANDPLVLLNRYGGEIQVRPTVSPEQLLSTVLGLYQLLGIRLDAFNYTTNLHVHIRVPGLDEDLASLKRIERWLGADGKRLYSIIEPIPPATPQDGEPGTKRQTRRGRSHQYILPPTRLEAALASTTIEQFHQSHYTHDHKGKPLKHLYTRPGVNLVQLWGDTNTIEFRHFTMSPSPDRMLQAFNWPLHFLRGVLDGAPPEQLALGFQFQPFWPFNKDMDHVFQLTNVYHNKRSVAQQNYRQLVKEKVLTWEELGRGPY